MRDIKDIKECKYDKLVIDSFRDDDSIELALTKERFNGEIYAEGEELNCGEYENICTPSILIHELIEFLEDKDKYRKRIKKEVKAEEEKRFKELEHKYKKDITKVDKFKKKIKEQEDLIKSLKESLAKDLKYNKGIKIHL